MSMTPQDLLMFVEYLLAIAFLFTFAIFIHELGHFMFAKLFGVRVETFSIGFGKKLVSFRKGETEYCISLLPLGGYVKLSGAISKELEQLINENDNKKKDSEPQAADSGHPEHEKHTLAETALVETEAMRSKRWYQKVLILCAGCVNNVLTAVMTFTLMAVIGFYAEAPPPAIIGDIESVNESAIPLQLKDQILELDGKPVKDFYEFRDMYETKAKKLDEGSSISLSILRDATTQTIQLSLVVPTTVTLPQGTITKINGVRVRDELEAADAADELLATDPDKTVLLTIKTPDGTVVETSAPAIAATGRYWPLSVLSSRAPAIVSAPEPNLPADKAGILAGDLLTSVNGIPIESSSQATNIIRKLAGQKVPFVVKRNADAQSSKTVTMMVDVRNHPEIPNRGQVGIGFASGPRTEYIKKPVGQAFKDSFYMTYTFGKIYVKSVKKLFRSSFQTVRESFGGPIAIGLAAKKARERGWIDYFHLFAAFNIILAIMNMLPIPVLDGGAIVIATIEAVIRRPLPARLLYYIYNSFIPFFLILIVLIMANDIEKNFWRFVDTIMSVVRGFM